MGERVYSLVARDSDGSRVVAELGRDFSPGAFGIFNEAELGAGAEVPLGPRTAHVVRSEIHNRDQNLAGLELCQEDVTYDTVCALGAASKPTFDKFHGVYYLGWQERTQIDKVSRSVFNIDVSTDGKHWERKYRFETTKSFQYPTFVESNGQVWLSVTQGDSDPSRKERIMFGRLE
jgi:hypothetical protein